MQEFIKNVMCFGLGMAMFTKEKVEQMVTELVEKGEINKEESKKFIEQILEKGRATRKEVMEQIGKQISDTLEKLNIPKREEVESLRKEIKELKEELKKLKK